MKKRFSRKQIKKASMVRGAYDKDGTWWFENEIKTFTRGLVYLCFGKEKNEVEIIEIIPT